jgi:hypothetical protein
MDQGSKTWIPAFTRWCQKTDRISSVILRVVAESKAYPICRKTAPAWIVPLDQVDLSSPTAVFDLYGFGDYAQNDDAPT